MTITETIALAIADGLKSHGVFVSNDLRNCSVDGGLFDMHSVAGPIIEFLSYAGYAIVPVAPSEAMVEAASDYIMPPPMQDVGPIESMEAREPYKAPEPIVGETHGDYIMRMAESFEQWANRK